jgi:hypothetical protein
MDQSQQKSNAGARNAAGVLCLVTLAALGGLAVTGAAHAQCTILDATASLQPTKAAVDLGAGGIAGLHIAADCSQMLGVNVIADLPDGEEVTVVMTTSTDTVVLGVAPMFQGLGQLVIGAPTGIRLKGRIRVVGGLDMSDAQRISIYRNPNGTTSLKGPMIRPRMLVQILDGAF